MHGSQLSSNHGSRFHAVGHSPNADGRMRIIEKKESLAYGGSPKWKLGTSKAKESSMSHMAEPQADITGFSLHGTIHRPLL